MVEKEHSEISPSGSKRALNCPGSVRLCRGIESVDTEYAKEGKAAHYVADHCLSTHSNTSDLTEGVDTFVKPEIKKYVDQEMFDHVQTYLDVVYSDAKISESAFDTEKKLDLSWLYPGMKGTCDSSIGEFMGLLRVYDFKYGVGVVVEPEWNEQAMLYALGLIGPNNENEYDYVELTIVQPRATHPHGPTRRWRLTIEELFAWAEEFKEKIKVTEQKDAPLVVGTWCQSSFCPAVAVCPAIAKAGLETAMVEFDPVKPMEKVVSDIVLPTPELLTEVEIAKVLTFTKLLSFWAKEVEAYALHRMEGGSKFPGWKLVAKKSNRRWTDESSTIELLHQKFGKDIYTEPKLKSPAQMEKLIGIDKNALSHYWDKPDTGVVLATADDKRAEVAPTAIQDFGVVEEDDFLS